MVDSLNPKPYPDANMMVDSLNPKPYPDANMMVNCGRPSSAQALIHPWIAAMPDDSVSRLSQWVRECMSARRSRDADAITRQIRGMGGSKKGLVGSGGGSSTPKGWGLGGDSISIQGLGQLHRSVSPLRSSPMQGRAERQSYLQRRKSSLDETESHKLNHAVGGLRIAREGAQNGKGWGVPDTGGKHESEI
jgi:hypothetical protein